MGQSLHFCEAIPGKEDEIMGKRWLSLLLAAALCLTLTMPAVAAKQLDGQEAKGYRSIAFQQNENRYADDDVVRVIVTLREQPAMLAMNGQAEAQAVRVQREQSSVQRAMTRKGVDYTVKYSFDTLLNGFSCDVAYGDLDAIAGLSGVEAVYVANSYSVPTVLAGEQIQMSSANVTTGVEQLRKSNYYGQGMLVAVLDTGLNTTHEAFRSNEMMEETGVLTQDAIAELDVAQGAYLSAKVPFAYDYADWDDDVTDSVGHGTHVSGTIVGLTEEEDGSWSFSGAAPYAQLISMKIFEDQGASTTTDIYFQAMEDAYKLGADVINLSIGAQNGFTYDAQLENDVGMTIFQRLSAEGIVISVAGGNQYSMDYYSSMGYTNADYQDYGTIASPATYEGSTSVAAMENLRFPFSAFSIDGTWHAYFDNCKDGEHGWLETFGEEELSYVIVPDVNAQNPLKNGVSLGLAEDFEGLDLTGKIAVVQRGNINYLDKVSNAAEAGAAGCLVVNTESTNEAAMSLETYPIPAVLTTVETLEALLSCESKTLRNSNEEQMVQNAKGGEMCDFSNWGTSPDLTLDPVITSIGGMVYSALINSDDDYEIYSGTSMAAPNFSGAALLTMQYLRNANGDISRSECAELALALLEGTAVPVLETENDYYSVRKQGAGMANAWNATYTHENSAYLEDPIQELGDDAALTGEYQVKLTFVNDSASKRDVTYRFDTVLQCGDVKDGKNTLTTRTLTEGEDYTVSFSADTLTVKSGESAEVTATITLTENAKQWLEETFAYGTYIEGYVFAEDVQDETVYNTVHATLLAYYGDWSKAPVAETVDYGAYLNAEYDAFHDGADVENGNIFDYLPEGTVCYTRPNMALTATFVDGQPDMPTYYVGGNLYDIYYETQYDPAHNAMSTVYATEDYYGFGTSCQGIYVTLSQLRNLTSVTMTVSDAQDGTVYYTQTQEYLSKCYYDNGWYPADMFWWDGSITEGDLAGEMIESGTVVNVTFDGILPWNNTEVHDLWQFSLTVDYDAPYVTDTVYNEEEGTLTVTAADNHYLASILLKNEYGDIQDVKVISDAAEGEEATVEFDVSWMVENGMSSVNVVAVDYATNESYAMPAPLYEMGKEATVTLVTPAGTEEYPVYTGEYFELPEPDAVEGYQFSFWTDHEVQLEEDSFYIYPTYAAYEWREVSGDMTYYAVYAKGEIVEFAEPKFYVDATLTDYSGSYAIVGLNTDAFEYFICEQPQIMNEELVTVDGVETYGITPPVIDEDDFEYNFEFFSEEDSFCYELVCEDGYYYTIQNSQGKYLALNEDYELVLADEVDYDGYTTMWDVQLGGLDGNVTIRSAYDYDMVLGYNDAEGIIGIWDDTVYVEAGDWGEMLPSEWYYLWLYRRVEQEFAAEYYTTMPGSESGEEPEPIEPVEPEKPAKPTPRPVGPAPVQPVQPVEPVQPVDLPFTDVDENHKAYAAIRYLYEQGIMDGIGGGQFAPDSTLTRSMVVTILYRLDGKAPVSFAGIFSDVEAGLWYSDAIEWAASCGIVNGVGGGKFDPNGIITREQLAAILQRYAAYKQISSSASAELEETAQVSGWAKANVQWAVALNLLEGGASVNAVAPSNRAEVALAIYGFIQTLLA